MMTAPGASDRLLVVCALGIEHRALRSGARRAAALPAPGAPELLRTGMGPRAARRSVARRLSDEPVPGGTAVLATGFCAGLVPGMRPGDLVVAEETSDGSESTACTGAELLAAALLPYGRVHRGLLAGSDHVVRGAERAVLRAGGAVAADMESAAVLHAAAGSAGRRPVAAVRVVVDAPGHELVRAGTLRGGISALRRLRTVLPAFLEWHRSLLLPWR
nr:1-hydroxy-2-methyl-2-butenyl 4-diphosphate reductase [Streptomyces sulphureus]